VVVTVGLTKAVRFPVVLVALVVVAQERLVLAVPVTHLPLLQAKETMVVLVLKHLIIPAVVVVVLAQ
jgi:hypothetical protein